MPLRMSPRAAAAAAPACARATRPSPAPARLLPRTITQTAAAARTSPSILSTRQPLPAPIRSRAGPFSVSTAAAFSSASSSSPATPNPPAGEATPPPAKPDYLNEAETVIWDRLVAEFAPAELVVQDISGGCGSMYGIEISSDRFRGLGVLKQQRMVNSALADLMKGWHGVQLRTRAP